MQGFKETNEHGLSLNLVQTIITTFHKVVEHITFGADSTTICYSKLSISDLITIYWLVRNGTIWEHRNYGFIKVPNKETLNRIVSMLFSKETFLALVLSESIASRSSCTIGLGGSSFFLTATVLGLLDVDLTVVFLILVVGFFVVIVILKSYS